MMRIIDAAGGSSRELENLCARSVADFGPEVERATREILSRVQEYGDEALVEYTRQFDCEDFCAADLLVSAREIEAAYDEVPPEWIGAFRRARENVLKYQQRLLRNSWLDDFDGVFLGQRIRPVASTGAYIPAGTAPLPSSICMTAMPAKAAGVPRIVIASPPRPDGSVHPTMAVAAAECGVEEFYRIGGAQAIAALAYGTETVEPVDMIVGPGNPYVITAKKMVFGHVNIEALPGPSESVIIADGSGSVRLAAADLLTQAEHSGDNMAILITDDEDFAWQVREEAHNQAATLPRQELLVQSLVEHGAVIIACNLHHAAEISNRIAPEHLQIVVREPMTLLQDIEHAGCVFLGEGSTVPLGDYAAGPSHVLPTNRTARFSSALSAEDFLTKSSLIYATDRGLRQLGPDVQRLAEAEGLDAHARSVEYRLREMEEGDE
ncbi:MAG: histidinol dehydrogenase [Armatimonadota bacterium]